MHPPEKQPFGRALLEDTVTRHKRRKAPAQRHGEGLSGANRARAKRWIALQDSAEASDWASPAEPDRRSIAS